MNLKNNILKPSFQSVLDKYGVYDALNRTIRAEDLEQLEIILGEYSLNINNADRFGTAPVFAAITSGKIKSLERIMQVEGFNINLTSKMINYTPIMMAAHNGQLEMVKMFSKHEDINLEMIHTSFFNLLTTPMPKGHKEIYEFLLSICPQNIIEHLDIFEQNIIDKLNYYNHYDWIEVTIKYLELPESNRTEMNNLTKANLQKLGVSAQQLDEILKDKEKTSLLVKQVLALELKQKAPTTNQKITKLANVA